MSTGTITTIAGTGSYYGYSGDTGYATSATLSSPRGVAVDSSGGFVTIILSYSLFVHFRQYVHPFISGIGNVYIADYENHRIRKMTVSTGIISTIAGTDSGGYSGDGGDATSATLNYPYGVAVDTAGGIAVYCVIYFVTEFIISFTI